jgi:hypothetical protein
MSEVLYCANHPKRETSLRCNRCNKPICPSCAVRVPTGYRCRECVRSQLKVFENAQWYDYLLAFVAAVLLSGLASIIITFIATIWFGLLVLVAAPFAGTLIARVVQLVVRRRRSNALFLTAGAGVVIGGIPAILTHLASVLILFGNPAFSGAIWSLLPLVWQVVYLVIAVPTVYAYLRGIQIK